MKKIILILVGISVFLISNYSRAEEKDAAYELKEIVITATKTEAYQAEIGSSTTVITAEDLKKKGKGTVLEVLRDVSGVSVMQSGAFGGLTSVYLRGSKSGHTLVLIDGVEVNDPIKADKSFDYGFGHLVTDNIERIEIVRGPQSTLYGSDAIGGVINIITKKGKGRPKCEVLFEGGSYNTFKERLGFSGSQDKLNYSLSLLRLDSDGISKAIDGSEDDAYENTTLSTRLGYEIFENANLDFVLRFTDAKYDSDDGAYDDDPNNVGWWRNIMGKIAFDQAINSIWDHKLSFSYSQTRRKYKDEPDSTDSTGPTDNTHNWFKSNMEKFEWQHNICAVDWDTITCGFEYEEERGFGDGRQRADRIDRKTVDSTGYYLQNQFKLWKKLFITPGLRIDDHELFGTETTYKISSAYNITQTGTRFKANWGTGFKAPSLYQLYHPTYGDTNLNPDESKSYDFGFEQSLWERRLSFGTTYFHNEFKNMVDYDKTTRKYKNIGRAETEGIETEVSFKPTEDLITSVNYTYLNTKDKNTGKKLDKRPENKVGLNLNWAFLEKGAFNLEATYVGHSWNNTTNTEKIKPYTKVDISASYDLSENFQIFGRIENLFDRKYAETRGYATAGRSFYIGAKTEF